MRRAIPYLMIWVFLLSACLGASGSFVLCRPGGGSAHVDGPLRRCRAHTLGPGGSSVRAACTDNALACGATDAISVSAENLRVTVLHPAVNMFAVRAGDPPCRRPPLHAAAAVGVRPNDPLSQRRTVVLVI
jgi:hypothetical protein